MKQINKNYNLDLILEVTNSCNMSCKGCYASNVLTSDKLKQSLVKNLTPNLLELRLIDIDSTNISSIGIRGGEPTQNPNLSMILKILRAKFSDASIFLETNAVWIDSSDFSDSLLSTIKELDVILKVSMDSMHGSTYKNANNIQKVADYRNIKLAIAVTENNEAEFDKFIEKIDAPNAQFIYQKKSYSIEEVIKPTIGVIDVLGNFKSDLTMKFEDSVV